MKTSHTTLIRGATFSRAGTIKLPAGTWSIADLGGPDITIIVQW